MSEGKDFNIAGRSLRMPGLKPSDFYLLTQAKVHFDMDMRQVVVLGLRWLYAAQHDPVMAKMVLDLASTVHGENLDIQGVKVIYTPFNTIAESRVRRP